MTDELATAVREWLRFDNEVEPPNDDQSYDELVAYERAKMEITERVAAALEERDAVRDALEWAIERLETPKRPDGTYNYSRAAIAQRLRDAIPAENQKECP